MNDRADDLPAELLFELKALQPTLERNGVVQLHHGTDRRPTYRLRFREYDSHAGYTRHRSIPLGHNPIVVQAVAEMIRRWQDEHQAGEKQIHEQPPGKVIAPAVNQTDPALELAQELCGGGRRRRKHIGEWYEKALSDPIEMFRFNVTSAFPGVRKGGRPPNKRSW